MADPIRISAVIPTFNRAGTVARAVESALSQNFPPLEVIVIDDGSTDGTEAVLKVYGDKIRRIRQENAGVSSARNKGVGASSGEWIAFLDSDDYWEPGHLARLVEAVQATESRAALYFCDASLPAGAGGQSLWERYGFRLDEPFSLREDAAPWVTRPFQPMLLQASLIKRAAYWEVGGLPPRLRTREDTLLFFKLGLRFPACAVSGRGTVMTSDDARRLTRDLGSAADVYWTATLGIYKTLLDYAVRFRPEYAGYFRNRLSAARFSMGRLAFRRKKLFSTAGNLVLSALRSPSMFLRCFRESLRARRPE